MEEVVNKIAIKFGAIYILSMIDYFLTCGIIAIAGQSAEANPWLRFLMKTFNTTHAIGYAKIGALTLLGCLILVAIMRKSLTILERISRVLSAVTVVMFCVVCYVGYVWIQLK